MERSRRLLPTAVAMLATLAVATLPRAAAALEAKVFAIGDFVESASGGCGGGDRTHWPDMVDEWYDHMWLWHGHTADGQFNDGNMTVTRFCDPDWNASCRDYEYVDEADAAMLGFHGSDSGDHWLGTMRWPALGGNCGLEGGGTGDEVNVGDVDLEFIHLSSCLSADDDNLSGIRFAMTDPVDGGHAHQWDGFHGCMWIGSSFDDDYHDFAHDAHYVSMANAWVTNHYHNNSVDCGDGSCDDQCPVAYAIGANVNDALTRLLYERYNNVYSDPTGHSAWAYMYYGGCDPLCEDTFAP